MAVIWFMPSKKCILAVRDTESMFFQDMQSFFEFLVSVINQYRINLGHLILTPVIYIINIRIVCR